MSVSLSTLAPDCIENLVHYLDGNDFISLMMSGDMLLRHKLLLECRGLSFAAGETADHTIFPFSAFNLPNLRSISLKTFPKVSSYAKFTKRDHLDLSIGCKTLEKLELDFCNCASLFVPSSAPLPTLKLRDRFPSLSTLILSDIAFDSSSLMEYLLAGLPNTLSHLSISLYRRATDVSDPKYLYISCLSELPISITTLKLNGFHIIEKSLIKTSFARFPPNLTSLDLDLISSSLKTPKWPSELRHLRFSIEADWLLDKEEAWTLASSLPQRLVSLSMNFNSDGQLILDAPLPPTLEMLEIPTDEFPAEICLGDFPRAMKWIPEELMLQIYETSDIESILKGLPNLKSVFFSDPSLPAPLPGGLESISMFSALKFDASLPIGLKRLAIHFPILLDQFQYLPSTLKSLQVGLGMRGHDEKLRRSFPPWSELELTHLVSNVHLESLSIEIRFIRELSCLAPLAKMETLRKLKLCLVPRAAIAISREWLPNCLPRDLKSLKIDFSQYSHYPQLEKRTQHMGKFRDDFLRHCNLAEVTPNLKVLDLRCSFLQAVTFGPSFDTMPRGLLRLKIFFEFGELEQDALSRLPRSLKSWRIEFNNPFNYSNLDRRLLYENIVPTWNPFSL